MSSDPIDMEKAPGMARCPGESWEDILASQKVKAPPHLWEDHYEYRGSDPIATARYTSPEFFRAECAKMWPNVWQFAAREEELQEPGDYVVYENAGRSYLVVRQQDGSIRAFHNVCLHRGRKLAIDSGSGAEFRCPFHGFTWSNDGSLKHIPCDWDFPHLKKKHMSLPEATVARWQGFVFVRENPEGPGIEEYLAPLSQHFVRWRNDECFTAMWVGKIIKANWKVVMEAFMEAWHSIATHPQFLAFLGDANTRYDIYGDHVNRALTPAGVLSPHLANAGKTQQWVAESFLQYNARNAATENFVVPEGMTARQALADHYRQEFGAAANRDYSDVSDGEVLDSLVYNVFPNFSPWGGLLPTICYRWRPWPDQDRTLMEVRILARVPQGQPTPRCPPMHLLGEDQPWGDYKEWGILGSVFDQDMNNLPYVQEGLKVSKNGLIELGNYQEIRIRQFHQTMDKYLSRP
jgi:phenylpropionate dioxygenase-like ring-hydroxylating dioxygenase large terminal subunit